jgi:quercetin dioxygenase-like cupin family protein
MLRNTDLAYGKLKGTVYDFENEGDELELHVHDENDVHISIVAKGSVKIFGPEDEWEPFEAYAGSVLDWEPGQWHGFIALEPNTRLVNIIKG